MRLKSRLGLAAAGHGAPHALGGGGHVDIDDAERRQRIHHRVHDRRRRADGAGLAAALGAQRIVRAERGVGLELERKEIVGTRHAIVHERARLELAALVVIDRVLVERLADALDQRAMDLALDDQRVDDAAEVVGAGEVDKLDRAGLAIDFDLGDIGARRDR